MTFLLQVYRLSSPFPTVAQKLAPCCLRSKIGFVKVLLHLRGGGNGDELGTLAALRYVVFDVLRICTWALGDMLVEDFGTSFDCPKFLSMHWLSHSTWARAFAFRLHRKIWLEILSSGLGGSAPELRDH